MNYREKALYNLKVFYGYNKFREGQIEIIFSILSKRDVFCIMPTGAGKSLCYQIPALMMEGITIVISPLISLMKDQVDNLREIGISANFINSTQDTKVIDKIIEDISMGLYKIIYIAPERLENNNFINKFKNINISQVSIDEAHCVSEWGHDFRKSYRHIKPFVNSLKERPIVSSFTATATEEVRKDTRKLLGLKDPYIFTGDINRENLSINILKEEDKIDKIKDIIRENSDESGIVYCLSRKETEELYHYLREYGFNVSMYHGGLTDKEKERYQEDFLFERTDIMIATNAFGMGIDKSNIRFIIHCTIPKSLESYYQEIGRGGRDGEYCNCYLLYNRNDIKRVEFLLNKSSSINRREISLRKLQSIIEFCEHTGCYRNSLLKYFHENFNKNYCGNCSNCLKDERLKDYTREAQIILSTVFRTRETYGISVISDILRGIKGPKIIKNNLTKITTFGLMKEYSNTFIKTLIKEMLNHNYIKLKEGTYSLLNLNDKSIEILKGNKNILLIIKEEERPTNEELYKKLKLWRRNVANRENIKPYIIFSDSTLIDITNKMPKSKEELLEIRGVGQRKIQKYGDELLKLLIL